MWNQKAAPASESSWVIISLPDNTRRTAWSGNFRSAFADDRNDIVDWVAEIRSPVTLGNVPFGLCRQWNGERNRFDNMCS